MPPRKPDDSATADDPNAWSRAPRTADAVAQPPSSAAAVAGDGPVVQGTALARELAATFRDHVRRALGHPAGLDDSETSLAFVDHYLRTVRSETRAPILALIAAEAGAYYGELVCGTIGGTWIGDRRDPRRLRVLMRDQFLHFSPVDQALEVLLGRKGAAAGVVDADPDTPIGVLDTEFHAHRRARPSGRAAAGPSAADEQDPDDAIDSADGTAPDDATWLAERLSELPPVSEDEYYTLTCRYEALKLVLELLATKHVTEGKSPREYHIADYVAALADRG